VLFLFHPAEAQKPPTVRKIGFLASASGPAGAYEVFRRSLRELGYAEGNNIVIEYRSAEGRPGLLELANELVREKVEVIVANGGPTARSAKDATHPFRSFSLLAASRLERLCRKHRASGR